MSRRMVSLLVPLLVTTVLTAGALTALAPSASAASGDAVVPGAPRLDATFENIGLFWPISGDADRNASLTILFRKLGDVAWRPGAVAMKAEPTTIVDGAPLGLHYLAASALGLVPGTTYEVQGTVADPDGGGTTSAVLTATTRTEPIAAGSSRTRYVAPGSGGGDGSAGNPFRGLQAAADVAQPGDLFLVAAGTYAPFTILTSGTPSAPVVFRGPASGTAAVDGANTDRGIVTIGSIGTGGHDVIVEGLTIQNGHWGVDADSTHDITIRGNVIRDVDFGVVNRRESGVEHNQTIVDNLIIGRTVWPQAGIPAEQGMELRGDGNVVGWNRIDHFADCISIQPVSGPSYGNDVVGNDVSYCVDDGIQIDYNEANVRVWRNRATDTRMGVSVQPIKGGPAYIFRNEFLNQESNPIKMNNNPSGFVVEHNTSVKNGPGIYDPAETWRNAIFRNNLMLGTGYAFEFTTVADEGFRDFDYDAWGTTRAGTSADPRFKWDNVRYNTLADLQAHGVETHGVGITFSDLVNPALPASWDVAVAPGAADLRPKPATPPVDHGGNLTNVNDGYVTDGLPDMGAIELGQPRPRYGPRSGIAVAPDPNQPSRFVSYGPVRELDTRTGEQGSRHPGGSTVRAYTLRDVPAKATAVTLNVTATNQATPGYLSVFPCNAGVPPTSSLNYRPQRPAVPNQVTVAAADGQVCVLSYAATDVIIDLAGWWEEDGTAELVAEQRRLWDTRTQGGGRASSVLTLDLTPLSAGFPDLSGVSVNVTGVDATAPGYLTVYDCDTGRPNASNVNVQPGVVAANQATVALRSAGRRLCIFTLSRTGIVVDLTGWWVGGSGSHRLHTITPPDRRLDTRQPGAAVGRLAPYAVVTVHAAVARSLFVNVTATGATAPGYISVFPCAGGWPGTSTVNFDASGAVANAAVVDASSGICATSNTAVDLILDVFGESS